MSVQHSAGTLNDDVTGKQVSELPTDLLWGKNGIFIHEH